MGRTPRDAGHRLARAGSAGARIHVAGELLGEGVEPRQHHRPRLPAHGAIGGVAQQRGRISDLIHRRPPWRGRRPTSPSSASIFGMPWAHGVHLPQVCAALACNCPSTIPTGHWPGGMASTRRAKASTNSPVRASARAATSTVKRPIALSFLY